MKNFTVKEIGKVSVNDKGMYIVLDKQYIPALTGLDGFSHLNIFYWFDGFDDEVSRAVMDAESPYKKGPELLGIFATRSPLRPNPIALSAVHVINIDYENGIIQIAYIDANDGSPVIDIKPYTPSIDKIENPVVPQWCSHWPKNQEESGNFDWENEFNF